MALMVDYNAMWDTYILAMPRASLKTAAMGTVEMKCHTCPSSIQFPMISIFNIVREDTERKKKHVHSTSTENADTDNSQQTANKCEAVL